MRSFLQQIHLQNIATLTKKLKNATDPIKKLQKDMRGKEFAKKRYHNFVFY